MRILVTGAGRAIGAATAAELARGGHHVIATARDTSLLDELDVADRLPLDVTDLDSIGAALEAGIAPRNVDVMETLIRTRLRTGESIEEVRPLVKEVLFYETRPSWVCWAKEQLSRAPENAARLPLGPSVPGEVPPPEPLFKDGAVPPPPRDTPSPKVAQPNLPNQATSSTGPVLDGPVLEAAQSEHGSAATSTTPSNQPLLISSRPSSSVAQSNAHAAASPSPIIPTSTSASSTTDSPSPGTSGSQDPKSAPALPEAP